MEVQVGPLVYTPLDHSFRQNIMSQPIPLRPNAPSYPRPHWFTQGPVSQTRAYVSPDPSPTQPGPFLQPHIESRPPAHVNFVPSVQVGPALQVLQCRTSSGETKKGRPKGDGNGKRRSSSFKKTEGKQPTFLTKLYAILSQPEYQHIIRWDDAGEMIIIERPADLAEKILPLVYRQSRFASFSRQLNIYGFMRKVSLRHVDHQIHDPDASSWSHPFLRRSSTAAQIRGFKRRVPPRPSTAAKHRTSALTALSDMSQDEVKPTIPDLSPTDSEGSFPISPDAYHRNGVVGPSETKPNLDFYPARLPQYPVTQPSIYLEQADTSSDEHMYLAGAIASYPRKIEYPMSLSPQPIPPAPMGSIDAGLIIYPSTSHITSAGSMPLNFPQTAPAHLASFPPISQISQGHLRTRSVQGEPPTASMFSPIGTSVGQTSWYNVQSQFVGQYPPMATPMGNAPTYDLYDPSTWSRSGYTNIHTGQPIYPVFRPGEAQILGSSYASVPNNFAPTFKHTTPFVPAYSGQGTIETITTDESPAAQGSSFGTNESEQSLHIPSPVHAPSQVVDMPTLTSTVPRAMAHQANQPSFRKFTLKSEGDRSMSDSWTTSHTPQSRSSSGGLFQETRELSQARFSVAISHHTTPLGMTPMDDQNIGTRLSEEFDDPSLVMTPESVTGIYDEEQLRSDEEGEMELDNV